MASSSVPMLFLPWFPPIWNKKILLFSTLQKDINSLASATIIDQCQPNLRQAIHQSGRGPPTQGKHRVCRFSLLWLWRKFPLSEEREREERSSFCKSIFSREGLLLFSWIPLPSFPSLLEYQLPLLSPYNWTKALFGIPFLFAQAVSVVSMLVLQILFWKGSRVPSLGSFCAISGWTSILWDYLTQNL